MRVAAIMFTATIVDSAFVYICSINTFIFNLVYFAYDCQKLDHQKRRLSHSIAYIALLLTDVKLNSQSVNQSTFRQYHRINSGSHGMFYFAQKSLPFPLLSILSTQRLVRRFYYLTSQYVMFQTVQLLIEDVLTF